MIQIRKSAFAILLITFGLISPLLSFAADHSQIFSKVEPSVFFVAVLNENGQPIGNGTGFAISSDGIVVTNWHVVKKAARLILKTTDNRVYQNVQLIAKDERNDLALLKIDSEAIPALTLGDDAQLRKGQEILVLGNPKGIESWPSEGIVASRQNLAGIENLIGITAPISTGSSGSPVFTSRGDVMGIATLGIPEGQSLNFAVPVSRLRDLLKKANLEDLLKLNTNSEGNRHNPESIAPIEPTSKPLPGPKSGSALTGNPAFEVEIWRDSDYLKGFEALVRREYTKANQSLETASRRHPQSSDLALNRGYCLSKLGKPEASLAAYKKATQIDPSRPDAHYNLGNANSSLGRYADAINSFESALALNPQFVAAWINLGRAQEKIGKGEAAMNSYRRALDIDGNHINALLSLAKIASSAEAERLYRKVSVLARNRSEGWAGLATVAYESGDYTEALEYCNRALEIEPENNDLVFRKGLIQASLENRALAMNTFNLILERQPSHLDARKERAKLFADGGMWKEALNDLAFVAERLPDDFYTRYLMGFCYQNSGEIERARAAYQEAKEIEPANSDIDEILSSLK